MNVKFVFIDGRWVSWRESVCVCGGVGGGCVAAALSERSDTEPYVPLGCVCGVMGLTLWIVRLHRAVRGGQPGAGSSPAQHGMVKHEQFPSYTCSYSV